MMIEKLPSSIVLASTCNVTSIEIRLKASIGCVTEIRPINVVQASFAFLSSFSFTVISIAL